MKPSNLPPAPDPAAKIISGAPRPRWWRTWTTEGNPPQLRALIRWNRILLAAGIALVVLYLGLTTLLWSYYVNVRKVPGVHWVDVVLIYRFGQVEEAIGAQHFAEAKEFWAKGQISPAIFTARAALQKSPTNLDARLFLAGCWLAVGRPQESIRTLRDGIPYSASDARLQTALVQTCLQTNHFKELLAVLRTELPAQHVSLLEGDRAIQLAEVRAVFETETPAAAEACAASHPGLESDPHAAPLLGEIDWQLHKQSQALALLRAAYDHDPRDPAVEDTLIDLLIRSQDVAEARKYAMTFFSQDASNTAAQLRVLEVFGDRSGEDAKTWAAIVIRMLAQYRQDPNKLGQLASLAASHGWSDLTYLLYQNSLQENLTGFPFVIYYVGSLIKAGDLATADEVWHELATRNGTNTASAAYIAAMIDWGRGRQSEALQILDQLRHDTADDKPKRTLLENTFRSWGYDRLADLLSR